MDQRLTVDHYKQLLLNRFGDPEIKFVKADIQELSDHTEGFMGAHFKLKLIYSKDGTDHTDNLFIKTKPFAMTEEHPVNANNMFDKEMFYYDFLFKEFEKAGFDTSFAANCYLCVNGETLIMEDMMEKEYRLPKRQTFYDVAKVKCLLKSLALLHGGSYAFEKRQAMKTGKKYSIVEEYPEVMNEIFFTQYTTGKGFGVDFFKSGIMNFKTLIDLLPKDDEYKNKFKQLLDEAEIGKIFVEDHGLTKVCCHGDLWSNNMMFKYSGETVEVCCLLDYQICRYFYPAYDVLLAINFNTNEEFRKDHLEEMYQYYYNTLTSIVEGYGNQMEEFMSEEDFRRSLDICNSDALFQVASVNSMTFVPADYLDKYIKDVKGANGIESVLMKEQMDEKTKQFCPMTFKTDEIYRNAITKHLCDLYDALVQKYCKC